MEQQAQQVVTLRFTVPGINYVMNLLAQKPYGEVAPLIEDLHAQLQPQLVQEAAPQPVPEEVK